MIMTKEGIILSKKHGLNPSNDCCPICGKSIGTILFGKLKGDQKAPTEVSSGELCNDCKKVKDEGGLIIIEVKDNTDRNNPYRTGKLAMLSKEYREIINIDTFAGYMEEKMFTKLFGEKKDENS